MASSRQAPRAVRVFVSSTFRDFVAERDRLARFVFPEVRKLCEERGVVFTDVDLRWGITDEQAAEGRVLPICLEEIDRSRPFFIGLLGERYGWVPESIDPGLIEREPWLAEHLERSVTELEIVHGVLNDPKMASRAFFYLRDPAAVDDLPLARRADHVCEDDAAHRKLENLKARIRASGLPVREGFRTPEELDGLVVADLTAAIDQLFPEEEAPDPITREHLAHEAFATELAEGFVERRALSAALDAHVQSDGPPLLVTGASGCGKSALLAVWSLSLGAGRTGQEAPAFLAHFCGPSTASAHWTSLCRRVTSELARLTDVEAELPDDPRKFSAAFRDVLYRAAAKRPFVLVLDGVDQLEDRDGAPDLAFLPLEMPPGCRLILSAASGTRPTTEAVGRRWAVLDVGPLSPAEIPEVVSSLLARRRRKLSPDHLARVCASPAASSPLFLSVLADELSVVGSYDSLDAAIERYTAVASVESLYGLVLERWEGDYDARPGLVADAMRALWAARRGLSEQELLEILGFGSTLPHASLAPLLFAAGRQLSSRSGLIGFAHRLLSEAVEWRYLPDEDARHETRLLLANYFGARDLGTRQVEELPHQLEHAGEWDRLADLLWDLGFFAYAWDRGYDRDVVAYWHALRGRHEIAPGYMAAIERLERSGAAPEESVGHSRRVGWLLDRMGFFAASRAFHEHAARADEELHGAESAEAAADWRSIGLSYYMDGDFKNAFTHLKRALEIQKRIQGPEAKIVADLFSDIGLVNERHGRYADAEWYAERALRLRERLLGPEHPDVALSLNNLAAVYHLQGLFDQALPLYRRSLAIREKVLSPEDTDVAQTLNNLGSLYFSLGRYEESVDYCHRALRIMEQAHGPFHLDVGTVCNNLAIAYQKLGSLAEAERWMRRVMEIDELTLGPEHPEVPKHLCNLGCIYADMGRYQDALPLKQRALEVAERVFGAQHYHVAQYVKELAATYVCLGDLAAAEPLLHRAGVLVKQSQGKSHPELAAILFWTGIVCEQKRDFAGAEAQHRRAAEMAEKVLGPEHPDTKLYRQRSIQCREAKEATGSRRFWK
jgi:tetratricopeptide (TPR) repeat protein